METSRDALGFRLVRVANGGLQLRFQGNQVPVSDRWLWGDENRDRTAESGISADRVVGILERALSETGSRILLFEVRKKKLLRWLLHALEGAGDGK